MIVTVQVIITRYDPPIVMRYTHSTWPSECISPLGLAIHASVIITLATVAPTHTPDTKAFLKHLSALDRLSGGAVITIRRSLS